ncbi:MAG: ATP-binding protein, partial [Bacteroidota bacterium]
KFLTYMGHFWNTWAVWRNVVIVLTSFNRTWFTQNVINHRGELHGRITTYFYLKPLSLLETEEYLKSRNINFPRYQITQLYMAFGGIPLYLEAVEGRKSAIQNINDICFEEQGLLRNEFNRLYPALFDNADLHIAVVRALAKKNIGMSRTEIIKEGKLPNGSSTTKILEELEQTGFIMAYHPFGKKKKNKIYRLIDEYSLFYLKFIEQTQYEGEGTFVQLSQLQSYKIWCGYAFEGICMKHVPQIKEALGVGGVYTNTYSYLRKGNEEEKGLQIDMLLERADKVIHLFEIKFYGTEFPYLESFADKMRERMHLFMRLTKTKHHVRTTMITTFGLTQPAHRYWLDDLVLTLEDLFQPLKQR